MQAKTLDQARELHPNCSVFEVVDHGPDGQPAIFAWESEAEAENDDGSLAKGVYWLAENHTTEAG